MKASAAIKRVTSFRNHTHLWLAVSHFLPANLMKEFCDAMVYVASNGQLSLSSLFEEQITEGPLFLRSWCIRPRCVTGEFAIRLQNLVRGLLWENDHVLSFSLDDISELKHEREQLRAIEATQIIAICDLESLSDSISESAPKQIEPLVDAMIMIRDAATDSSLTSIEVSRRLAASVPTPLAAVLLKHLGDLCVDIDQWTLCGELYKQATKLLTLAWGREWKPLRSNFEILLSQSKAATVWATQGPWRAKEEFDLLTSRNGFATHPQRFVNASYDHLNAFIQGADNLAFPHDDRCAILSAPHVISSRGLANAFERWKKGQFDDANRLFWSVLRRQIALGSVTATAETKAHYACCMLDSLERTLDTAQRKPAFKMAVRLLLDSGDAKVIGQIRWTLPLVEAYVDFSAVCGIVSRVESVNGFALPRRRAAIHLFQAWLVALAPQRDDAAEAMMRFLATGTSSGTTHWRVDRDVTLLRIKALREVAKRRPEFRPLAVDIVTSDLLSHVMGQDRFVAGEALETLDCYIDAVPRSYQRALILATLDALDRLSPTSGDGLIVRPALNILVSKAAQNVAIGDSEFRARMVRTTVLFALGSANEHNRLLLLLRDLDPELVDLVEADRLGEVVESVRRRARNFKSSEAAASIYALLAAPRLSKLPGVKDALNGLVDVLEQAAASRHTISFSGAYSAVIQAATSREEIARAINVTISEFETLLAPILSALQRVWRNAADNPLIFSPFQLPPATKPNPTLVHNWTFASLTLSRALHREGDMNEAMQAAANVPLLVGGIASGRAARVSAGDASPLDLSAVPDESRDAFYGALGRRLIQVHQLSASYQSKAVLALLEGCFRLGPRGIDAGVFALALSTNLRNCVTLEGAAADYRGRLSSDRELRLSLGPMLEEIQAPPVLDA